MASMANTPSGRRALPSNPSATKGGVEAELDLPRLDITLIIVRSTAHRLLFARAKPHYALRPEARWRVVLPASADSRSRSPCERVLAAWREPRTWRVAWPIASAPPSTSRESRVPPTQLGHARARASPGGHRALAPYASSPPSKSSFLPRWTLIAVTPRCELSRFPHLTHLDRPEARRAACQPPVVPSVAWRKKAGARTAGHSVARASACRRP
jgi:hypothetical protein